MKKTIESPSDIPIKKTIPKYDRIRKKEHDGKKKRDEERERER